MTDHFIWAGGLLGDLLILAVLFARRRVPRFPWFALLIGFHFLAAIGLKAAFHLSGHEVSRSTGILIDFTDLLLQCAVLAELTRIASLHLARNRRLALPLLLVASGILIMILAPAGYHSLSMGAALMHLVLSVLLLEWAVVLAFLLRVLGLTWRSHVAAISFGYGVFAAVQLAAGTATLNAYVSPPLFRVSVYLLVLLWWSTNLWLAEPGETPSV